MSIYTRRGDDGTTGLLYGGRVPKNSPIPCALGDIDEAQSAIGLARVVADGEILEHLTRAAADLWTVMGLVAQNPDRSAPPPDDGPTVDPTWLESAIDDAMARFTMPTDFVVPGGSELGARLDLARAVVRRAERSAVAVAEPGGPTLVYLNRLADLLWALARWADGEAVLSKDVRGHGV